VKPTFVAGVKQSQFAAYRVFLVDDDRRVRLLPVGRPRKSPEGAKKEK
jgi:hypothetical protein